MRGAEHEKPDIFFHETRGAHLSPRALFVDLDPDTADELRSRELHQVLHPEYIVVGKSDAAGNFALIEAYAIMRGP